jgi:L-rhamnose mutarotase
MEKLAFKMKLLPGFESEYQKRHDEIWPDLIQLLKAHGISDYSIFLDTETLILFAVFMVSDKKHLENLPNSALMQKWWEYMADIMDTNFDNSPVSILLESVFYME